MTFRIRPAEPRDAVAMHELIVALAEYEHAVERVRGDAEALQRHLFADRPAVFAHVAVAHPDASSRDTADATVSGSDGANEHQDARGREVPGASGERVVGMALWFLTYSTWEAVHGIHLEDLFVLPEERGRGIGLELMRTLARECADRGYARLEWQVLDWNRPAIDFYDRLGASTLSDWLTRRLEGDALVGLGARPLAPGPARRT